MTTCNAMIPQEGDVEEHECGKDCRPIAIVQFRSTKFICPDGHEQTIKETCPPKVFDRQCDDCAKEGKEEWLLYRDTGLHTNPPQVGHDYYLQCMGCGSQWIEEAVMQKRNAYRFRKEPQLRARIEENRGVA